MSTLTTAAATSSEDFTRAEIMRGLYGDGMVACRGALERDTVAGIAQDVDALFEEALARPGGAVGRGPRRWYVEIHPERLRAFRTLVTHPWIVAVCEAALGDDYRFVELGFDVPGPGAIDQPWHRDFPAPPQAVRQRRLSSVAFNITTVDVRHDMGPFEIAPGTQWDDDAEFEHGMFPPKALYPRYASVAQRKTPQMGDVSARSGLAVHRGTANASPFARPVLVLGAVAADTVDRDEHELVLSRAYAESLPAHVRRHLLHRAVERLEPLAQRHTIEGLVMGAA